MIVPIITPGVEYTNRYGRDVIGSLQQAGVALHAIVIGVLDFTSIPERERALVDFCMHSKGYRLERLPY